VFIVVDFPDFAASQFFYFNELCDQFAHTWWERPQ